MHLKPRIGKLTDDYPCPHLPMSHRPARPHFYKREIMGTNRVPSMR